MKKNYIYNNLIIMSLAAALISSPGCSCQKTEIKPVDSGYYSDTIQNYQKASKDSFKNAFEIYTIEQKIIEKINQAKSDEKTDKTTGQDKTAGNPLQKNVTNAAPQTIQTAAVNPNNNTAPNGGIKLSDDLDNSSGVFAALKPLVKENKISEIIAVLNKIESENKKNPEIIKECYRKLALCYYVSQDMKKYEYYNTLYYNLVEKEQEDFEKLMLN
ncbi:MAG: hypothetical protein QMC67_02325 [Candidatus Wallbacteria bacterium]